MKIVFLGAADSPLIDFLKQTDDEVTQTIEPLNAEFLRSFKPDWMVSYNYRHIIKPNLLALYPDKFINLHIAYLPWNRGADPNLWSWIEGTPKGVTVHYIDAGIDTGDIIAQKEAIFNGGETLASSYARLQKELQRLFQTVWPMIKNGTAPRTKQHGPGSFHRVADKTKVEYLLTDGWSTPAATLLGRFK